MAKVPRNIGRVGGVGGKKRLIQWDAFRRGERGDDDDFDDRE